MKNRMWPEPARVLGVLALLAFFLSPSAAFGEQQPLFVIARSTNRNIVQYRVRLDRGKPDTAEPIVAHWIMRENGGQRESLTWLERRFAYGWEVVGAVGAEAFALKLVAFEQRPLRVVRRQGTFRALIPIAGRQARLSRIFVKTREGTPVPKVLYVELHGTDDRTGEPISERVVP